MAIEPDVSDWTISYSYWVIPTLAPGDSRGRIFRPR